MDGEGRSRRACLRVIVCWFLSKTLERVNFRPKGFTAIALIRSIKLSHNSEHKQPLLANETWNDLLRFSSLPQFYDLGKVDLDCSLHWIFDPTN